MSRTLTIELPEHVHRIIQRTANTLRRTPQDVAAEWLGRVAHEPESMVPPEADHAVRQRFRALFGSWDSGDPASSDNERIDADLAREYGSTHEDDS